MPAKRAPQEPKDPKPEVIRMYLAGAKLAEITAATHVPRATIYYILESEGIEPNRLNKNEPTVNVGELLDQMRTTERENGVLREQLADRERQLAMYGYLARFLDGMKIPRPDGGRSWTHTVYVDGAPSEPARPMTPAPRRQRRTAAS